MDENIQKYSDAVIFDPTYKTNPLNLPFAAFLGINNNGKSIILACCFLSNETIESFRFVFQEFLSRIQSGPGAIKTVMTDEDLAMTSVISSLLPDTSHRLCCWHLTRNIVKNLSGVLKEDTSHFLTDVCRLQKECFDVEIFEEEWCLLKEKYPHPKATDYIQRLHDVRKKWARCFFKSEFDAGMNSSQRGESFNSKLKGGHRRSEKPR
jgi:zinc finger SWIM domain-containing protein 3